MIEALITGERNPGRLADLALGRLRRKTEELQLACDGRFTAADCWRSIRRREGVKGGFACT